jgi:hypothetical protein
MLGRPHTQTCLELLVQVADCDAGQDPPHESMTANRASLSSENEHISIKNEYFPPPAHRDTLLPVSPSKWNVRISAEAEDSALASTRPLSARPADKPTLVGAPNTELHWHVAPGYFYVDPAAVAILRLVFLALNLRGWRAMESTQVSSD